MQPMGTLGANAERGRPEREPGYHKELNLADLVEFLKTL
jgi:hypothetical protein